MTVTDHSVTETAAVYLKLQLALSRANAIRWTPAPRAGGAGGTVRNGGGGHGDPTGDTVLDARRLAVSEMVHATEADLRAIYSRLVGDLELLEEAMNAWEGSEAPKR